MLCPAQDLSRIEIGIEIGIGIDDSRFDTDPDSDPDFEINTLNFHMKTIEAYLSVGSNIGDKPANCRRGIEALTRSGACRLLAQSPFYRTEPVDYTDQEWFVNAVVKVETDMDAADLLRVMLNVEREIGRVRGEVRFGPRVLDLDLIFYGDRVIDLPGIAVPHPRMHKRRFVLKPICDINSTLRHPSLNRTVQQLLEDLDPDEQQVEPMPCDC